MPRAPLGSIPPFSPSHLRRAERHLAAAHPVFERLIAAVGRCTLRPMPDLFDVLVRTVVSQQISVKAADSICNRMCAAAGRRGLTARSLTALSDEVLRGCGLSTSKLRTMRELSTMVTSRRLNLKRLLTHADDRVAESLLPIPGIGPWSVQMVLIFGLCRLDILPIGDLGFRQGACELFGMPAATRAEAFEELAEAWRPYRTVATWYIWRSRRMKLPSDPQV